MIEIVIGIKISIHILHTKDDDQIDKYVNVLQDFNPHPSHEG